MFIIVNFILLEFDLFVGLYCTFTVKLLVEYTHSEYLILHHIIQIK